MCLSWLPMTGRREGLQRGCDGGAGREGVAVEGGGGAWVVVVLCSVDTHTNTDGEHHKFTS